VYGLLQTWQSVGLLDLGNHVEQPDPHSQYQLEVEKDEADGYAGLNSAGQVVDAQVRALHLVTPNHIVAELIGTPVENAVTLRAQYAAAKALTPNGAALSTTNRATLFITPGTVDFGTGDGTNHGLILDAEFVDVVALGNVTLTSQIETASRGTLEQTADDVRICALGGTTLTLEIDSAILVAVTDPAAYFPDTNLPNTVLTNVVFSCPDVARPTRRDIIYSGTYNNCRGDCNCVFGVDATLTGRFVDCAGLGYSFCVIF